MKKLLLLNWPVKLFCLVLAVIIWSFINHWVTTNDGVPSRGQLEGSGEIPSLNIYRYERFHCYRYRYGSR